jgi:hypothetical protein
MRFGELHTLLEVLLEETGGKARFSRRYARFTAVAAGACRKKACQDWYPKFSAIGCLSAKRERSYRLGGGGVEALISG